MVKWVKQTLWDLLLEWMYSWTWWAIRQVIKNPLCGGFFIIRLTTRENYKIIIPLLAHYPHHLHVIGKLPMKINRPKKPNILFWFSAQILCETPHVSYLLVQLRRVKCHTPVCLATD